MTGSVATRTRVGTITVLVGTLLSGGATAAPAAYCAAADQAILKMTRLPNHQYLMSMGEAGEKPTVMEIITLSDARFSGIDGSWTKSYYSGTQAAQDTREKMKNAKRHTCQFVRNESVDGETTSVYSVHDATDQAQTDTQLWISARRAVPVKLEIDLSVSGKSTKTHISERIDYDKVAAPTHFQTSAAG